ncbi:hypothetical protein NIES4072_62720 [Nostoc commune NIES-4072]|uniref:Uncharacterized protein n=1 Tax=Nostoc commune NIES-4072 TaxID=2005467 RepID=A0A2R5G3C4_NOSCO|nr:hypothetical protein NIES4070_28240 [Nostoc commune HK-02]GBG22561.1 hypothetical protein NIES4072_62720 [Nostoc commune NIES-4072]
MVKVYKFKPGFYPKALPKCWCLLTPKSPFLKEANQFVQLREGRYDVVQLQFVRAVGSVNMNHSNHFCIKKSWSSLEDACKYLLSLLHRDFLSRWYSAPSTLLCQIKSVTKQLIRIVWESRRGSHKRMFRAGSDVHGAMLCQFYRDCCESARSQVIKLSCDR